MMCWEKGAAGIDPRCNWPVTLPVPSPPALFTHTLNPCPLQVPLVRTCYSRTAFQESSNNLVSWQLGGGHAGVVLVVMRARRLFEVLLGFPWHSVPLPLMLKKVHQPACLHTTSLGPEPGLTTWGPLPTLMHAGPHQPGHQPACAAGGGGTTHAWRLVQASGLWVVLL